EPAREAAAESAAQQARTGAGSPIAVGGAGARGMQPSIKGVAKRMVKKLTVADSPTTFETAVPAGETVPAFKERAKDPIWDPLLTALPKADVDGPSKLAPEAVRKHVGDILAAMSEDELKKVAELAVVDKRGGKTTENPDGTKSKEKEIDIPRFVHFVDAIIET